MNISLYMDYVPITELIRLLYYLPMERMKHTGDFELDEINMLEQECADLEEDNKRLEEENKKLREKLNKIQEAYIIFEKLDSQFQKWLGELDQLIMNR